jgi:hypothetical protein
MAFSLLANSSSELDGNQEMELTIGSLSIIIGPSGSSRLSDSTKSDPSANKPEIEEMLELSKDSSSEVNSLEEEENDFIQETPEAALVAAQAYLLTTRPEPRDP